MRNSYFILPWVLATGLVLGGLFYFRPVSSRGSGIATGIAVVELFTSEGCSSCPPADQVLARINKEFKTEVFVLGYHVDYWNNLGWKDQFSDPSYTRRQQDYAVVFGLNSIYTPQVVLNGKFQFVGSDESQLRRGLQKELEQPAGPLIKASAMVKGKLEIQVSYGVLPRQEEMLEIALIQFHASSLVKKGENEGRLLEHINLVRDLKTMLVNGARENEGTVSFSIPAGLSYTDLGIIAFLQEKQSRHIQSAVEIGIQGKSD
jgi:hypothetical protein